jgi:RHS repeat-associated protein
MMRPSMWSFSVAFHDHFKFTGKERDSESGLDNFGARYDASSLGRFMSPDPLGGQKIDPQTLNKYAYVRNNPINLIDPTGLYVCKDDPKDGSSHCASQQDQDFEKSRQAGGPGLPATIHERGAPCLAIFETWGITDRCAAAFLPKRNPSMFTHHRPLGSSLLAYCCAVATGAPLGRGTGAVHVHSLRFGSQLTPAC